MELINATRMAVGYNLALERSGRESLVVVIKGTFVLPKNGEPVRLADEQSPLIMADTFTGEPGLSSPVHEMDFAPRKPMCDVLLVGCAHAPAGQEVTRMRAGLRVGSMQKVFNVVGDRVWQAGLSGIRASNPERFTRMPISYDRAFGGIDANSDDAADHDAYLQNPVGRGWHRHLKSAWVDGKPLPNIEKVGEAVVSPASSHQPMALGPVGRGWPQRACFAGTYDRSWLTNEFPMLPVDFDDRYYQAAPQEQCIAKPDRPTDVVIEGFHADGDRHFTLPFYDAPVQVFPKRREREHHVATLDTIAFEPDEARFTMTWRLVRPLERTAHDIAQVLVGRKGSRRWPLLEPRPVPIPVLAAR